MGEPDNNPDGFVVHMSASACLTERIDHLLGAFSKESARLDQNDLREYGVSVNGVFDPYWRDDESFQGSMERLAGIDRSPINLISEATGRFFLGTEVTTPDFSLLFTPTEVNALLAQAILVQDEAWHHLAKSMQRVGYIPKGLVNESISPLESLHEEADQEIAAFYEEVRSAADGVYDNWSDAPQPETGLEKISSYKKLEVIYSEPKLISIKGIARRIWAAKVTGEATIAKNKTPFLSLEPSIDLLVLDDGSGEALTQSLFHKRNLMRYWIGAEVIELQRSRMEEVRHIFGMISARKEFESEGEGWKFDVPARKPMT